MKKLKSEPKQRKKIIVDETRGEMKQTFNCVIANFHPSSTG